MEKKLLKITTEVDCRHQVPAIDLLIFWFSFIDSAKVLFFYHLSSMFFSSFFFRFFCKPYSPSSGNSFQFAFFFLFFSVGCWWCCLTVGVYFLFFSCRATQGKTIENRQRFSAQNLFDVYCFNFEMFFFFIIFVVFC